MRKPFKLVGLRLTQVIMAVLFAYYHDRSGATLHWQLLGPGVWGIIYGISAVWSKGISMPTGIHSAVNIVLAILGTKATEYAIWNLDLGTTSMEMAGPKINFVGILLQGVLLIFGILLTEYYIRNKRVKID